MQPLVATLICTLFLSFFGVAIRAAVLRSSATTPVSLVVAAIGVIGGVLFGHELHLPLYGTIVASAVAAYSVLTYGAHRRKHLGKLKETAPDLQGFVLRFFDQLDSDGDGVISLSDLTVYFDKRGVISDPAQAELLQILDHNHSRIGHVTGTGAVVAGIHGATVYNIYGVSRDDILSWPERASRDFDQEFGGKESSL
jgi:hypothetical protein